MWKYILLVVTAIFGIIGIWSENKNFKPNGTVSKWGKGLIVGIGLIMILGVLAQISDDRDAAQMKIKLNKIGTATQEQNDFLTGGDNIIDVNFYIDWPGRMIMAAANNRGKAPLRNIEISILRKISISDYHSTG